MDERAIVKTIIKTKGFTQTSLAQAAGFKSQSNITGMLNNSKSGMKVDNLVQLLEAMGCELVIRDKYNHKVEWVVTKEE